MNGGKVLDKIEIDLRNIKTDEKLTVYVDAWDNSLGRKWLTALNELLKDNYHLEMLEYYTRESVMPLGKISFLYILLINKLRCTIRITGGLMSGML